MQFRYYILKIYCTKYSTCANWKISSLRTFPGILPQYAEFPIINNNAVCVQVVSLKLHAGKSVKWRIHQIEVKVSQQAFLQFSNRA